MPRLAITLPFLLAACAPVPEIDTSRFAGRIPPAPEGTPRLAPIEVPPVPGPAREPVADPARLDALRGRAAALSGPVIPADELGRLERARDPATPPPTDPGGGDPSAGTDPP